MADTKYGRQNIRVLGVQMWRQSETDDLRKNNKQIANKAEERIEKETRSQTINISIHNAVVNCSGTRNGRVKAGRRMAASPIEQHLVAAG